MVNAAAIELEPKTFEASNGTEVLYRFAVPAKIEEGKAYPLVLFLHGSGQRGSDNKAQLKHGAKAILQNAEKLGQPMFVIAPQCPADKTWAPYRIDFKIPADEKPKNPLLDAVLALIEETASKQPVDRCPDLHHRAFDGRLRNLGRDRKSAKNLRCRDPNLWRWRSKNGRPFQKPADPNLSRR